MSLRDKLLDELDASDFKHLQDLTVLTSNNDPYRQDVPSKRGPGEWFAAQVRRLRPTGEPLHLRGFHYALINTTSWDGQPYANTFSHWDDLQTKAADGARWLGLLPFDQIVDERNNAPVMRIHEQIEPEPYISIGEVEIDLPPSLKPTVQLPAFPEGEGEEIRRLALQEHRLTIFGEKSSLEPVLGPIATRYGADLFLPTGEASETMIYALAKAAARDGRRMIVFYVSDFDPSGRQMATSVSRKLQAFRDLEFPSLEFELFPIALTLAQCKAHNLPETPLSPDEARADKWRAAWGWDQTEIDALATLQPGVLRGIVTTALDAYYDHSLDDRVREARDEWREKAQQALEEQLGDDVLDTLVREAETKLEEIGDLVDEVNDLLRVDVVDDDLPDFEAPEALAASGLPEPPLIDSDDDYVTATRRLIKHKNYGA